MKKSLVLAMAMALGVTASAYAANPFSDVPAGHWAYDSISKLAAEGVIEGYGDATFGGDKLMTRYEMAQIVAKAMAKGANCDKLAAEFADELDNLGVRVANLEKKADNVKITGQIRAHYRDMDNGKYTTNDFKLRTRLTIKGQINEDWTYTGRLQNERDLTDAKGADAETYKTDDDKTILNWAYVTGKVGGVAVDAGRQDFKIHTGSVVDTTFDGVKVAYGKDIKVAGYAGKAYGKVDNNDEKEDAPNLKADDRFYAVDVSTKLGVFDAYVTYYKADAFKTDDIYVVGASTKLAKDLKLTAEYIRGDFDDDDNKDNNGYVVGLAYKGASAAKVGSWGIAANYYNQPAATMFEHTIDGYAKMPAGFTKDGDGFKGYDVSVNYTVAKNIVAAVKYYDLDAREGNAEAQTLWSEVVFTF